MEFNVDMEIEVEIFQFSMNLFKCLILSLLLYYLPFLYIFLGNRNIFLHLLHLSLIFLLLSFEFYYAIGR